MRLSAPAVYLSLLLALAVPAGAQSAGASLDSMRVSPDSAQSTTDAAAPAPTPGASMTGLRAGVHARETARPDQPVVALAGRQNLGQARAMMVVGGAALIVGAIIGDTPGTIIMVGGAVIGLIGLYDWLQ